jgi:hypothetical protein
MSRDLAGLAPAPLPPRAAAAGAARQLLGVAHRQLARGHLVGGQDLLRRLQHQQRAGVAHLQVAGHQHLLHRRGQVEQAQQVAGGAARAAHGLRGLLVREPELVHQALQALRLFQRVEVLALDVLDQRHHRGGLVGHLRTSTGTSSSPASARRGSGARRR